MANRICWGILGTGRIAQVVAQDFQWVHNAELVAVASRQMPTAQAFARTYGIRKAYGTYDDLLRDNEIDVVYIATPHMRHCDDALACIRAGKAVLCEKPFTLNAKEAEAVIQAARDHRVFCMEAMWMRFIPLMRDVKTRVARGEIGDVTHVLAEFGFPNQFDPNHRTFNPHLGGGSLLDRGIYPISLSFYLLGQPTSIQSWATIGPSGVDLTSDYVLQYRSGAEARLGASCQVYRPAEARIRGTAGELRVHAPFLRAHRITIRDFHGSTPSPLHPPRGIARSRVYQGVKQHLDRALSPLSGQGDYYQFIPGHGYQFELEAVTHYVQQGQLEHEIMPLDETLSVMHAMDEMRQQWGLVYPSERSG